MKGEDPMYAFRYTPINALTPALSMLDSSNTSFLHIVANTSSFVGTRKALDTAVTSPLPFPWTKWQEVCADLFGKQHPLICVHIL